MNKAQGKLSCIFHLVYFLMSSCINQQWSKYRFCVENIRMTWEGKSSICPWLCTLYRPVGRVQAGMRTDLDCWPKPAQSFALFVSGLAETDSLRHFSLLPFKTQAQQIKAGQTLSVACQEGQVAKSFSRISRHWEKFRRCLQAAEVFVEIPGCSFQEFTAPSSTAAEESGHKQLGGMQGWTVVHRFFWGGSMQGWQPGDG